MKIALEFDPPAGVVGVAIGELLGMHPQEELADDLKRFKKFAETELLDAVGERQGQ